MRWLVIDPGPVESAWLTYDDVARMPLAFAKVPNDDVASVVLNAKADRLAIEMIACYGMSVGAEVFETCVWIGRFMEDWTFRDDYLGPEAPEIVRIPRLRVKMHLCHSAKAADKNIRRALIDRWGPGDAVALGRKASPGPLYGIAGDCWAALGVAVTVSETTA